MTHQSLADLVNTVIKVHFVLVVVLVSWDAFMIAIIQGHTKLVQTMQVVEHGEFHKVVFSVVKYW